VKYHAKSIYPLWVDIPSRREADIKKELIAHGPIQTGFSVYEDFLQYTGGVYKHTSGGFLGGHSVILVGYESGAWIAQNSWGVNWGEKGPSGTGGYFRIATGNECGFEGSATAGLPKLE